MRNKLIVGLMFAFFSTRALALIGPMYPPEFIETLMRLIKSHNRVSKQLEAAKNKQDTQVKNSPKKGDKHV